MTRIFLIAGEPSGDKLGAALMAGLQGLRPDLSFDGVGGPLMTAQGLTSRLPMEELSVMGLVEVLPKYRALMRRIAEMAALILDTQPDILVTIDSPDFCLRVARRVKAGGGRMPVVHYVAPTVWAWRPGRADKMAKVVDHVLALLPFEPPYMQAAGMTCDFVGHPVVAEPVATTEEVAVLKSKLGISGPSLMVLPGSRRGEVGRLAPIFGAALRAMPKVPPILVPTVSTVADTVRELTADWPGPVHVIEGEGDKRAAFAAADVALAASGTVSLELAANATPMVIAYDMTWLSRVLIARMLRVDTVTLVNLVSETRAIPEFLGDRCRPKLIAPALDALINDPSAQAAQKAAMSLTMERLGQGGARPGDRAAASVLAALERGPRQPT